MTYFRERGRASSGKRILNGTDEMEYTVIVERGPRNLSAYVPDLPGCVATAATLDELKAVMREAIRMHIELAKQHGEVIPPPSSTAINVAV
jgi:predicted RNase H-like HicB family nuclease